MLLQAHLVRSNTGNRRATGETLLERKAAPALPDRGVGWLHLRCSDPVGQGWQVHAADSAKRAVVANT